MITDNQTAYKQLRATSGAVDLYNDPWWLDLACGEAGWNAVIAVHPETGQSVAMPYAETRIRGMRALITPPLTQWVQPQGDDGLRFLLPALPPAAIVDLQVKVPIPAGLSSSDFQLTVRYSYVLPAAGSMDTIRSGYNEGLRRNLREARDTYTVESSADSSLLQQLVGSSFAHHQDRSPGWVRDILPRVTAALIADQRGQLMICRQGDRVLAAVLIAHDPAVSYYLAGGRSGDAAGASAHALLLDQAIALAVDQRRAFDFEGSMHPGIANFFQSFGARPEPFLRIRRYRGMGRLWSLFQV